MNNTDNVISLENLSFGYRQKQVLEDIGLEVPQGSVFGNYSTGMKQRLVLALGLLPVPQVS